MRGSGANEPESGVKRSFFIGSTMAQRRQDWSAECGEKPSSGTPDLIAASVSVIQSGPEFAP